MATYYTLLVPFVPAEYRTEWHPTEDTGPFAVLSRGNFKTHAAAIEWGRTRLGGTPYTVKACIDESEIPLRALAEQHNLVVWEERITEVTCGECDSVTPVPHDSAHADSDVRCPSCEHKLTSAALADTDRSAWWWWCCSPGCMPEGPPNGPHDSEVDALEDATEGLAD